MKRGLIITGGTLDLEFAVKQDHTTTLQPGDRVRLLTWSLQANT